MRIVEAATELGLYSANLVIVMDNAPAHSRMETRIDDELRQLGVKVLRLAPYSAPLNPIELIWCQIKSHIKSRVASSLDVITMIPPGISQVEHRFGLMETWAEEAFSRLTGVEILRSVRHCERPFADLEMLKPLLG